jgi:hypothetical protein
MTNLFGIIASYEYEPWQNFSHSFHMHVLIKINMVLPRTSKEMYLKLIQ